MPSHHVLVRSFASALALTGLVAVTAPAAGAEAAPDSRVPASRVKLEFVKNANDPSNSVLRVYDGEKLVTRYRAGSGLGTAADEGDENKRFRNDCARKAGWLPNGTYKPTSFEINRDKVIKGYAIGLPNAMCRSGEGTIRTGLFIHSEMTKDGEQGPRNGPDSPQRWDGVQDYKSWGCIKLHPKHIAELFSYMNHHGRAVLLTVR
ncbi:L,D-transpeptidase [Streptomyces sp. NPDC006527]|uniref:L,D-transpeptidase n=1 Tax=Streptomyces sp. NPDC006527 TaxID=3364749 RepID=UPI0036B4F818